MQQPPGPRGPQILFTRPAYEWINRVSQKHAELVKLDLSERDRESLKRQVESEFANATAQLSGSGDTGEALAALRIVEALARGEGPNAALTPELLLRLNNPLGNFESKFRMNAVRASGPFKPPPAEHVPAAVESVCRWLSAESFAELNPLEQASITHLRLLEIHPFERANFETAIVAASLFTMRKGMPPIIIKQEDSSLYRAAVEEGARMNTRPTVELMAAAMERTLSEMIMVIKNKS
ncbi:MAG TPA: Fic family protein [Blastocatellia bacterium]|nr:Fic family protein [Blastocatellia bacterium]